MLQPLTPRQREVYDFLVDYFVENQWHATVRELCAEFGILSPNGGMCHLQALEKKGWIDMTGGKARGIRILHWPKGIVGRLREAWELP